MLLMILNNIKQFIFNVFRYNVANELNMFKIAAKHLVFFLVKSKQMFSYKLWNFKNIFYNYLLKFLSYNVARMYFGKIHLFILKSLIFIVFSYNVAKELNCLKLVKTFFLKFWSYLNMLFFWNISKQMFGHKCNFVEY